MRDIEIDGYHRRFARTLNDHAPHLPNVDGEALRLLRDYAHADAQEVFVTFRQARGTTLELLVGLTEEQLQRPAVFEDRPTTMRGLAHSLSSHDAQFLASRGYAVLQVNYRGSGGRGSTFLHAGFRKWGTRIQDDLADGVRWAVSEGIADAKRVCVYGASFGGYAAMMSAIRSPDLFKCAVGYAGIYDLSMMYDKGDILESRFGLAYLDEVIGNDQAELKANSPVNLADKLQAAVLIVHGEADERAPFAHGCASARSALRRWSHRRRCVRSLSAVLRRRQHHPPPTSPLKAPRITRVSVAQGEWLTAML